MRKIKLTNLQKKIIILICEEFTSPEIAEKLGISKRTIEDYRSNIQKKIGAKNSIGIVLYAVKKKIYPIKNIKY